MNFQSTFQIGVSIFTNRERLLKPCTLTFDHVFLDFFLEDLLLKCIIDSCGLQRLGQVRGKHGVYLPKNVLNPLRTWWLCVIFLLKFFYSLQRCRRMLSRRSDFQVLLLKFGKCRHRNPLVSNDPSNLLSIGSTTHCCG